MDNIDLVARSMAAQAKATAAGTTNGETVDARTGADAVARASLGAMVREIHQSVINNTTDIASGNTASSTLAHGLTNIVTSRASEVVPTLSGRTLVNRLGRDGNCEDLSKWGANTSILGFDTTNYLYGTKSIKVTSTGSSFATMVKNPILPLVDITKYYIALVDIKVGEAASPGKIFMDGTSFTAKNGNSVTSTSGFSVSYIKIQPSDMTTATALNLHGYLAPAASAVGKVGYFDGFRLYEITAAEYALIDVDANYTGDKLADKFPYVDGVKHVQGPMLTKQGKNLLPPFTDWTLHANAVVAEPYKLTLNATAVSQKTTRLNDVLPNTSYTLQTTHNGYIGVFGAQTQTYIVALTALNTVTFNTGSNTVIDLDFRNSSATGTFTFTNPQLELGSTATTFEPQNIDYVYGASDSTGNALKLASSLDGTVKDSLYYRDGRWLKEKRWVTDVLLDGALTYAFGLDLTGFKSIFTPAFTSMTIGDTVFNIVKYDGKILQNINTDSSGAFTTGDQTFQVSGDKTLRIALNDSDTGFGETYTPTAAEIANFMNGWKLSDSAFAAYSTGTKYWTAVDSPKADFAGKVSASTVENANLYKGSAGATLSAPSSFSSEGTTTAYTQMSALDGTLKLGQTLTNTHIVQELFSFNLIEHVLRKYGSAVFGANVTTVDRVTWLKANVGKLSCNWWGYGSGPAGNKATLSYWDAIGSTWGVITSTTNAIVSKLTGVHSPASMPYVIDSGGFVHFLAYADASDGTTASTINTDFIELEVNLLIQTLPTGYATTSWTPYKLSYQLATTVEEAVTVEGAINLHTGGNQIEVSEGVVVREKVTPYLSNAFYYVNTVFSGFPDTNLLKNKPEKILTIYKNGTIDKKWTVNSTDANGKSRAFIATSDYDATAEYTITYTMLNKYANTAALNSVQADYSTSIKTIVDMTVQRLGDVETTASVNVRAIAELYKRVKALGG